MTEKVVVVEEAEEDKAIAVSSASEGVVGGVWKKSNGEPERGGGGEMLN